MGFDCTNYLPEGTPKKDVQEFVELLGYKKLRRDKMSQQGVAAYSFYTENDYKHITGIYIEIHKKDDASLCVWTRTTIWRSKADRDFQNYTIKQLKSRFGGYFVSDYGKNRYFKDEAPSIFGLEGGFYKSYSNFKRNMQTIEFCLEFNKSTSGDAYPITGINLIDEFNPRIVTTNITIPYIVSAVEDFFRSSYIALLHYSPRKENIIQKSNIRGNELVSISKGEMTVEEAVARWKSFQNLEKINRNFKEINGKLDIRAALTKPYRNRKKTLFRSMIEIVERRHLLIHHAALDPKYTPTVVQKDLTTVSESIRRVYLLAADIYGWDEIYWDL